MNATSDSPQPKYPWSGRTLAAGIAVLVVAVLILSYFSEPLALIGLPALLVVGVLVIGLWFLRNDFHKAGVQQTILFALLILGLGAHFFMAWKLFASGAIASPEDVRQIQRAGTSLFLPFLGVAIGGVFGVKRVRVTRAALHTFVVAISIVILWDALAIGNLWAMQATLDLEPSGWALEDVVRFAEEIMPLLSVLPAAAIGYYFGAQPTESDQ